MAGRSTAATLPLPRGDFPETPRRRSAQTPPASLIHVPVDGEEQIPISVLSPSASGALCPGSPGPSCHLMLCDPTLGLPLGQGQIVCPAGDTSCRAWDTTWHTGDMSCPAGDISCPTRDTTCPAGVTSCPAGDVLPQGGHVLPQ